MSNWFYYLVYALGWHPFFVSSKPTVVHRERSKREGAYILAPTHSSFFDVPLVIKETPRVLVFLSIVEIFRNPLSGWFLRSFGALPLDRGRPDSHTVRTAVERLKEGKVLAMFPEGGLRTPENSVLNGGRLKPGVGRLARMANVPVIPCVVVGGEAYHKPRAWLPLRRIRYGIIYGEAIFPKPLAEDAPRSPDPIELELQSIYPVLHAELKQAMQRRFAK